MFGEFLMIFIVLNYFFTREIPRNPIRYTLKLNDWSVKECNRHFKNYIDHSEFRGLVDISHWNINHILVSAFCRQMRDESMKPILFTCNLERWQSLWMILLHLLASVVGLSVNPYSGWCNKSAYEETRCDTECYKLLAGADTGYIR